ncbi:MAG: pilus assembly protein PilM [Candidatus Vogelbacteria bacterium]|nr:pilus assembly protein PilM [Candidatus Vogelbacteria bacterium]
MISRLFNFFRQPSVGLDIADRSIEAAELVRRGRKLVVAALARQPLPAGVVERGEIKDQAKLAGALKSVLNLAKPRAITPKRVYFGLPESQVYLHSFVLPVSAAKSELGSLLLTEAREHVPLETDDLVFGYKSLGVGSEGEHYLIAAASRRVLNDWRAFFHSLGYAVEFDLEALALFRSLGPLAAAPAAVADFGAVTTNIAVFDRRGLRYTRTLNFGAAALTDNLMKSLKLKLDEAEKQKREIGLIDPDSKIFTILLKSLVPLRDELKITLDYYERWSGEKVGALYLAGGGSELRGLADYLKSNLEIDVTVARSAFLNQPLVYLEALGLALKAFASRREREELTLRFGTSSQSGHKLAPHWFTVNLKLTVLIILLAIGALVLAGGYLVRQRAREAERDRRRLEIESRPVVSPELIFPEPIARPNATSTPASVTVRETPTGWLNVRSGPGTSFAPVGRVNPGEVYPLLSEEGEWAKIKIVLEVEEIKGWVNKQYIIKN